MDQTTVIKVNRPYNRHFIIGRTCFTVDKTRCVLIDFHTSVHQIQVCPHGLRFGSIFIRNIRGHDANIHPTKGRIADIFCQIIIDDQVRSRDIDVIRRLVNHILIDRLSNLRLVNRFWSTPIGNVEPFSFDRLIFNMVAVKILDFPRLMYQFMRKSRVKALTARPSKRMALSLPVTKPLNVVDVLVCWSGVMKTYKDTTNFSLSR